MPSVPIIVVTFNRPHSLKRLLGSLSAAFYSGQVKLIISIDGGGDEETMRVSNEFTWPFGDKDVIRHTKNLGLKEHIIYCAGKSSSYDGVIILEDDLFVSPYFYDLTINAAEFYRNDPRIAGISLYSHGYNETAQFPFVPIQDGSDVFFMQYASSWGQFWTQAQWEGFVTWESTTHSENVIIPYNIALWPESSWKKSFIRYMVATGRYFVYPRQSLTTNFSEAGQHMMRKEYFLQRPLLQAPKEFSFRKLDDSLAVYDSFNEILSGCLKKMCPPLAMTSFDTDLYGMKGPGDISSEFVLTPQTGRGAVMNFGRELKPMEANIIFNMEGDHFHLVPAGHIGSKGHFRKLARCSRPDEVRYHYGLRFYHRRWSRLILPAGNLLYQPVIFPCLKKLSGLFRKIKFL
jgi:hypothetical protein